MKPKLLSDRVLHERMQRFVLAHCQEIKIYADTTYTCAFFDGGNVCL